MAGREKSRKESEVERAREEGREGARLMQSGTGKVIYQGFVWGGVVGGVQHTTFHPCCQAEEWLEQGEVFVREGDKEGHTERGV